MQGVSNLANAYMASRKKKQAAADQKATRKSLAKSLAGKGDMSVLSTMGIDQLQDYQNQQMLAEQQRQAQEQAQAYKQQQQAAQNEEWYKRQQFQSQMPTDAVRTAQAFRSDPSLAAATRMSRGSGVTVNTGNQGPQVGTIPQGYQLTKTEEGAYQMAPIPGGPEDMTQKDANRQAREQIQNEIVDTDIQNALDILDNNRFSAGFVGQVSSGVRQSPAGQLQATLETIKGNVGFEYLGQMRQDSPTGGALGQVSDFENRTLQTIAGNLDVGNDPNRLQYNLERLRVIRNAVVHGVPTENGYEQLSPTNVGLIDLPSFEVWKGGAQQPGVSDMSDEDLQAEIDRIRNGQ